MSGLASILVSIRQISKAFALPRNLAAPSMNSMSLGVCNSIYPQLGPEQTNSDRQQNTPHQQAGTPNTHSITLQKWDTNKIAMYGLHSKRFLYEMTTNTFVDVTATISFRNPPLLSNNRVWDSAKPSLFWARCSYKIEFHYHPEYPDFFNTLNVFHWFWFDRDYWPFLPWSVIWTRNGIV